MEYMLFKLRQTQVTSPRKVKPRRLSRCCSANMFIGFTAVTSSTRMLLECWHIAEALRQMPFLSAHHFSSLLPNISCFSPLEIVSSLTTHEYFLLFSQRMIHLKKQLASLCKGSSFILTFLSRDDSSYETWELCNWLYDHTDERQASVVARIIELRRVMYCLWDYLNAPCGYCSVFVNCHWSRRAIAAIDGAIEGGSPPQTIVKRGSVRPLVWKCRAL